MDEFKRNCTKQAQALAVLEDIGSNHVVDVIKHDIVHVEEMIDRYNAEKTRIETELAGEVINEDF